MVWESCNKQVLGLLAYNFALKERPTSMQKSFFTAEGAESAENYNEKTQHISFIRCIR